MNVTTLRNPITLTQVALPIQVCYIIPVDAPGQMLSEIFNECYERWGGRDTLLIPMAADGTIDDEYWSWAQSLEPDIIYSYVALDAAALELVDRRLMPSTMIVHRAPEGAGREMRPRHDPAGHGLPSLSLLPMIASADRFWPRGRYALISHFMAWPKDPFVTDTFGLNPAGPGTVQSSAVRKYADIIALGVQGEAYRGENLDPAIPDATTLLRVITDGTYPAAISMAQLAGMGYDHVIRRRASLWERTFNIIVGDTALDRIAFWNCRLGVDDYQRKGIVAVRVDEAKLDDPAFIDSLARFVSRWNTSTSQNGPSFAAVRSSSIADDRLQPIVAALSPLNVHAQVVHFDNVGECAPPVSDEKPIIRGGIDQRYTESVAPLSKAEPLHLTKAGPIPTWFLTGGWTTQVTVKRENGRSLGSSIARLAIPRRWQAVRFVANTTVAKATVEGNLRLFVRHDQRPASLTFTDDDTEFVANLFRPYHHLTKMDPRNAIPQPDPIRPQTSSAGRHLRGFLNKLGTIRDAVGVTEDQFWNSVLLDMAVPREVFDDAKRAELAARLKKPLKRDGLTNLDTDEDFESLAETVAQMAPEMKTPVSKRPYEWFVEMYLKTDEAQRPRDAELDADGIKREINQEVECELRRRCAEGVLIQGYDWKCPRCLHRNWCTIDALTPTLRCEICDHSEAISAHFTWDFMLEGYIALGLRERGLRGLVWALGYLSWSSDDSFMFSPPLDLIQNGVTLTDADIACIVDNKFVIGEVKESARKINDRLGDRMIEHARKIKPDAVVLACYDPDSLATVTRQTDRIGAGLSDLGIDVKAMVPTAGQHGFPAMIVARGLWKNGPFVVLEARPGPPAPPQPQPPADEHPAGAAPTGAGLEPT